jgi:hypothetical protein
LTDIAIELRAELDKVHYDSDKETVSALKKGLQDKDKQIEILKAQIEEHAREMDKTSAIMNNMNRTFQESWFNFSSKQNHLIFFL